MQVIARYSMIVNIFCKGLFVLFCMDILNNQVDAAEKRLTDLDNLNTIYIRSKVRVTDGNSEKANKLTKRLGCLRGEGRKSHTQLIALKNEYLDTESATYKKLIETNDLPSKIDLSPFFPPSTDQRELDSSVANALVSVLSFEQKIQGKKNTDVLSWLHLHWHARDFTNTTQLNVGTSISDGIYALMKTGVANERFCSNDSEFLTRKPTKAADADASTRKLDSNETNQVAPNLMVMKLLLSLGTPIIGGIILYESFMSDTQLVA